MGMEAGPKRVLLVEDEPVVAMDLEMILRGAGYVVVGPATRLAEAMCMAEEEALDGAVLDVNLGGERVFSVAEALARLMGCFSVTPASWSNSIASTCGSVDMPAMVVDGPAVAR